MTKQNKDYSLVGRIKRILRPLYQIKEVEMRFKIVYEGETLNFIASKKYKYKDYLIALDPYKGDEFLDDKGISVEGHKTWKETVEIFLDLLKDYYEKTE